jgi:hypothetical protein
MKSTTTAKGGHWRLPPPEGTMHWSSDCQLLPWQAWGTRQGTAQGDHACDCENYLNFLHTIPPEIKRKNIEKSVRAAAPLKKSNIKTVLFIYQSYKMPRILDDPF